MISILQLVLSAMGKIWFSGAVGRIVTQNDVIYHSNCYCCVWLTDIVGDNYKVETLPKQL